MKLGLSEVIVLLIMGGIFLFVMRGNPAPRKSSPPPVRIRRPTTAEIEEERIKASRQKRMRVLGGAFVVIGLFVLAAAFRGFSYLVMMSTGAGLVILLGIVVLFLSARR